MIRIVRLLVIFVALPPLLFLILGFMIWASAVRPDGFFLLEAIRAHAVSSFWLKDNTGQGGSQELSLSVSAWIRPSHTKRALHRFDAWLREYMLIQDDTDEAVDGAPYVLPPVIIPQRQLPGELTVGPDSYDIATQRLIEDLWNSGFLVTMGVVRPESEFWLKSLLGWYSAGLSLEKLSNAFGLKPQDTESQAFAPYFLNWLNRQPSGELERETLGAITVHESVVEVNADQFFTLYEKLCIISALPVQWCSGDGFFENPVDPLLRVSSEFKIQLKYYWTIRGGALLWSNQKDCLVSGFEQSVGRFSACSDHDSRKPSSLFSSSVQRSLKEALLPRQNKAVGYFVNEQNIRSGFDSVLLNLSSSQANGSEWISDFLQRSDARSFIKSFRVALNLRAAKIPYWGAYLTEKSPGTYELYTVARWLGQDDQLHGIQRQWAESQFDFLYSVKLAWAGLPRTPARLRQNGQWRPSKEFKKSRAVFEIGWSEKE